MSINDVRKALPGIRFCDRSVLIQFLVTDRTGGDFGERSPAETFALIETEIQEWLNKCRNRLQAGPKPNPETAE